jgi:hypothetical protein
MKKLILVVLLAGPVLSNVSNAGVLDDDKRPKKGYNYKKHYRNVSIKHFFTRVFNLNNCYGRLNIK